MDIKTNFSRLSRNFSVREFLKSCRIRADIKVSFWEESRGGMQNAGCPMFLLKSDEQLIDAACGYVFATVYSLFTK